MRYFNALLIVSIIVAGCGQPEKTEPAVDASDLQSLGQPPPGMVLVAGGSFTMGGDEGDEIPRHTVQVDPFFLDKHEVTNRQYQEFIEATGHPKPPFFKDSDLNKPEQPVVGVSYFDAQSYAQWAGKRLPSEAEWECAARGGVEGKLFPWGDGEPFSQCNFAPRGKKDADGYAFSAPVGKFPANAIGLYDMAGNVWEWCEDFYDASYYKTGPVKNPTGPDSGYTRVLRGGSWLSINPKHLRCSSRMELKPFVQDRYYGFRCAKTP